MWTAPPHILVADTTGGLHNLQFDGTSFSKVGGLGGLGWVEAVWSDGLYFYVGAPGTGLTVVDAAPDGTLSVRAAEKSILAEARRGWFASGIHYVPAGGSGLFAFRFDGTTLTQVGSKIDTLGWAQGTWAVGFRVLFADAGKFRVLDFSGTAFYDVITPDATHPGSSRVWSDGDKIFVANGDGVTAYHLSGTTLTELDTFVTPSAARDVWSDGQHVFVAAEAAGLYALAFTNNQFSLIDQVTTGAAALGVFGDGTYIYANDMTGGLQAFGGFRCQTW